MKKFLAVAFILFCAIFVIAPASVFGGYASNAEFSFLGSNGCIYYGEGEQSDFYFFLDANNHVRAQKIASWVEYPGSARTPIFGPEQPADYGAKPEGVSISDCVIMVMEGAKIRLKQKGKIENIFSLERDYSLVVVSHWHEYLDVPGMFEEERGSLTDQEREELNSENKGWTFPLALLVFGLPLLGGAILAATYRQKKEVSNLYAILTFAFIIPLFISFDSNQFGFNNYYIGVAGGIIIAAIIAMATDTDIGLAGVGAIGRLMILCPILGFASELPHIALAMEIAVVIPFSFLLSYSIIAPAAIWMREYGWALLKAFFKYSFFEEKIEEK